MEPTRMSTSGVTRVGMIGGSMDPTLKCPECETETDKDEFTVTFCPSIPDKCNGCETDHTRLRCPRCDYEWNLPS